MSFGLKAEKSYHGLYSKKMLKKNSLGSPLFHMCHLFFFFFGQKKQFFCVYFSMQISGIVALLWKFINCLMTTTECYLTELNKVTNLIVGRESTCHKCIGILAKTTIVNCTVLLFHWRYYLCVQWNDSWITANLRTVSWRPLKLSLSSGFCYSFAKGAVPHLQLLTSWLIWNVPNVFVIANENIWFWL